MPSHPSALAALILVAGCATTALDEKRAPAADLEEVVTRLPGSYSNAAQYAAADDSLKITPEIGETRPWIDHQYALFKRVSAPAVAGDVIALEWRKGGPDGPVSRQRLWAFRIADSGVVMDFYALKAPIDITDAAAFEALTPENLIAYGDKCALPLRRIEGRFQLSIPETCRITTQSGRDMVLSAEIMIGGTLSYREAGRLADRTPIFEVPGGRSYIFDRIETAARP